MNSPEPPFASTNSKDSTTPVVFRGRLLKSFLLLIVILAGDAGCGRKKEGTAGKTNSVESSGGPLTAPVDYLGAVNKAQKSAQKTVDTAALTQALQQFTAAEGRAPRSLEELVSEGYLDRIPQAPKGMKFVFDAQTRMLKVVPSP